MAKDPLGWIIFTPADETRGKFIGDLAQAVRLTYRAVVEAGLRNPEDNFDPADYFGYVLPLVIPTNRNGQTQANVFGFGLVHKDKRPIFDGDHKGRNAHHMPLQDVLDASVRLVCIDAEDIIKSNLDFPMKLFQHKKWQGLKGWMGGEMSVPNQGSLIRFITKFLLTVPVMTEDKAADAAADLIKKFRGGN